ncbi:MAG: hypothetical protein AMXMBFR13_33550 [Phycisphaerae bacterium]
MAPTSLSAGGAPVVTIQVHNPTPDPWAEAPVFLAFTPAMASIGSGEFAVRDGQETLPVQRDDLDGDGDSDEIAFLVRLEPGQTREFELIPRPPGLSVPQRAHAKMSLKGYDGPGWESDVMAYRIYWNADNAMDIFGKTKRILSLEAWATPGLPHNIENEYGLDVLKVGRAFGVGGFGAFIDGKLEKVSNVMKTYHVRATGPVRAVIDLEYVYWQPGPFPDLSRQAITSSRSPHYDLLVRMSIFAGQRWGQADLHIKPHRGSPMPEIVTGVPKHEDTVLIQDRVDGLLGRWGNQALGDRDAPRAGNLGLGVVVDPRQAVAFGEDDFNTFVRLKTTDGKVSYRYHGSWFKEPGAAASREEYQVMLRNVARLRPEASVRSDE